MRWLPVVGVARREGFAHRALFGGQDLRGMDVHALGRAPRRYSCCPARAKSLLRTPTHLLGGLGIERQIEEEARGDVPVEDAHVVLLQAGKDQLLRVQEARVRNVRKGALRQVDERLHPQVERLVQWQELNAWTTPLRSNPCERSSVMVVVQVGRASRRTAGGTRTVQGGHKVNVVHVEAREHGREELVELVRERLAGLLGRDRVKRAVEELLRVGAPSAPTGVGWEVSRREAGGRAATGADGRAADVERGRGRQTWRGWDGGRAGRDVMSRGVERVGAIWARPTRKAHAP